VLLYLHLDPAKVVPMPPNGQDVSQKGHWGTGDLELALSSQAELDAAKPWILTAYEGHT
jgi:predicted transport protein